MSRLKIFKCFARILNCQPYIATHQNFSVNTSHCFIKNEIRRFTSSDISKPDKGKTKYSAIEPAQNLDLSDYGAVLQPSFNFAAYADKSPLLQEFIKLGVNLYEIEKRPNIEYILTLKWENVDKYLTFFTDNGVPPDKLGEFITLNPFIFKEDLNDLQVRINYLESKKFDKAMISNILVKNPKWLSFPVKAIDDRLGFIQRSFELSGDQVRKVISSCPSLATIDKKKIMVNIHTLKEELFLEPYVVKKLIVSEPKLLRTDPFDLISTFDYLTKTMNVSLSLILNQPKLLTCRKFFIMERHLFLESLGRSQYNNKLAGYVPLTDLIESSDEEFCEKIARTSLKCYEEFLKTL